MAKTFSTACPRNCYSTCSFKVLVEDNKVIGIEPNPENKSTPNGPCLKGLSYLERATSTDRILYPLKKNNENGKFERISWEDALNQITEKLQHYKKNFGCQSVMFYAGSGMSGLLNECSYNFWKLYGGATTHYGSLCWSAGLEATQITLGEIKHSATWDIENAKLIVVWGKNIAESNIHEMVPVENALANGAQMVVVDTRRTITAERASNFIQPDPGTDAALALGIANILIQNNQTDSHFIEQYVFGFEYFKEAVKIYTPQKVSEICNIPIENIYKLALLIGSIKPMTLIAGFGIQRYTNGGQTIRAILALAAITGNIGIKGAGWRYGDLQSAIFDSIKEPLSYYPPDTTDGIFRRIISVAKFGTDLLNASNPEIKMLWIERGNPLTSNPDTNQILKAFKKIEFKVVVEEFLTDTARKADIILPAKNLFEQSDIINSYWNPYIQLKQKVVEPPPEVKPETEIFFLLAKKLGFSQQEILEGIPFPSDEGVENFLKNKLEPFPEITLEKLKQGPVLLPNYEEIAFKDLNFKTPSGKIEIYSAYANERWGINFLPTYENLLEHKNFQSDKQHDQSFYLLTPNTKNRIHSQFNNLKIIKQFSPFPVAYINPTDAKLLKINNLEKIKIYNERGFVMIKANFSYEIKRGCIAITNGWWKSVGCCVNFLSLGRETDIGFGTAFHDNLVYISKI